MSTKWHFPLPTAGASDSSFLVARLQNLLALLTASVVMQRSALGLRVLALDRMVSGAGVLIVVLGLVLVGATLTSMVSLIVDSFVMILMNF